jgi:hypothetical protein
MAGYFRYELEDIILNLRMGDHGVSDYIADMMLSGEQQELIPGLLEGCRIDRSGKLHVSEKLSVQNNLQHVVDYAIWRILLATLHIVKAEPSLNIAHMDRITFRYHTTEVLTKEQGKMRRPFKLPPEIGQLNSVRSLGLVGLHLTDVPQEIYTMSGLSELDLSRNPLEVLPSSNRFPLGLRNLRLRDCKISDLPASLKILTSLRMLDISGNRFRTSPRVVWKLAGLTWLNISENPMATVPASLHKLNKLRTLFMGGNKEIGLCKIRSLPRSLRFLRLTHCSFKDLPESIGQLEVLNMLEVRNTKLIILPHYLSNLQHLRHLDISDNEELRYIDPSIAQLPKLGRVYYEGLHNMIPLHFTFMHGEGLEGFKKLLEDVRYIFGDNNTKEKEISVYHWIHRWRDTNFNRDKLQKCIQKAHNTLFGKNFFLNDLLNERSSEDNVFEALSMMRLLDMRFYIKALLSNLRIQKGNLYMMMMLGNPFEVPDHIIWKNAVPIVASLSKEELFDIFGEGEITSTSMEIDESIILPETFRIEKKNFSNDT